MTKGDETRKNQDTSLDLTNQFTSPNGLWSVALDDRDNLWLANSKTKIASVISAETVVQEIKWSSDSRYLALRFNDKIRIFDMNCKK
jgi:tricorn protease-like protein